MIGGRGLDLLHRAVRKCFTVCRLSSDKKGMTLMSEKKKNGGKRSTASGTRRGGGKNVRRGASSGRRSAADTAKKQTPPKSGFAYQLAPFIVIVAAILVAVCMYAGDGAGIVGGAIRNFLLGMNGGVAYALPIFILIPVVTFAHDRREGRVRGRVVSDALIYLICSILLHIYNGGEHTFAPSAHWKSGVAKCGGGVIGGAVGEAALRGFGKAGALVIVFAMLFILILYTFGVTPRWLWSHIRDGLRVTGEAAGEHRRTRIERHAIAAEERERARREDVSREDERQLVMNIGVSEEPEYPVVSGQRFRYRKKHRFSPDIPLDDDIAEDSVSETPATESPDEIDERIFDEAMRRTRKRREAERQEGAESSSEVPCDKTDVAGETEAADSENEVISAENLSVGDSNDLRGLFVNPDDADLLDRLAAAYLSGGGESEGRDSLSVTRRGIGEIADETAAQSPHEYVFPPISILTEDRSARDTNIRTEMQDNAVKLVETLRSFNVKTKIENVSRGPTITRYELLPEAGTRVRSIVNLIDDISLSLATTGVRIEAPIPGKAAVGIEVPNKKRATVHLRTLLEDARFTDSASKMTCALGEDVGGEAVYLDVAKMPHLLIAGATGMGKSVCINSLIVSLLYKAKPDEVKLILIDPKKVELNIYNGIPHLLVPVVSDPKKAAGSLSWAVSEMERRFGLIEAVGVRDINMYNKVTERDPEYEYLPYIVIIIDELADLMMTAPDDVEESICRLMQKARAAGMHVIIGTQRPSVDVITGLIKANIPSRIAFTVASQVDSRTIIDRSGAESLIGRGDMLYIPVGSSKPIRVQGAFVSEEDVEEVVTYIKDMNRDEEVSYSDDVMAEIERAAAKCGTGKKGAASLGDSGDEDPMLRPALELAVNSGKISTSLIQRRLSLGYGRAAKIIDKMEQLGYVSAPEGQKPREVLISKEQYMEMIARSDDSGSTQTE